MVRPNRARRTRLRKKTEDSIKNFYVAAPLTGVGEPQKREFRRGGYKGFLRGRAAYRRGDDAFFPRETTIHPRPATSRLNNVEGSGMAVTVKAPMPKLVLLPAVA